MTWGGDISWREKYIAKERPKLIEANSQIGASGGQNSKRIPLNHRKPSTLCDQKGVIRTQTKRRGGPVTRFSEAKFRKPVLAGLRSNNEMNFSLIEINFSYRRFWNFVLGSYPSMWYSISLRSFVNRTKWPSETRLFQFANLSQTGTAV